MSYYDGLGIKEEDASPELKAAIARVDDTITPAIQYDQLMKKYDEWASVYDHDKVLFGLDNEVSVVLGLVEKYSGGKKDSKILDVCAGTGIIAQGLYKAGYRGMDAVDGSQAMLNEAKKRNVYKSLKVAYVGRDRLDYPDNSYDMVTVIGSLCDGHIKPDCFSCLREFIRVTKPGGHFIGCMFIECVSSTYQQLLESAINALVKEGLWSWVFNGAVPEGAKLADTQQTWVLKIT